MKEIRIAMLGFGGIAASHKVAYDALLAEGAPIRLVAICDKSGNFDRREVVTNLGTVDTGSLDGILLYTDFDEMLRGVEIDAVDICLPTFLHKEFTLRALRAGKHVMCEKPMALSYEDACDMAACAEECGLMLMIGQCLRFDPCYRYLKKLNDSGVYGSVRRIFMSRLSAAPTWGAGDIYRKTLLTGGCTLDLHIHDLDILRYVFGEPESISSVGTSEHSGEEYITSRVFYPDILAEVEASFDESKATPFSMGYRVRFQRATVIFEGGKVTVYPNEGEPFMPEIGDSDRIKEEIEYFAKCVATGLNEENPARGSAMSVKLSMLAKESAELGGEVLKLK